MSDIEQTRKELKEILAKIPASGSFEGARLATQASQLAVKYADLIAHSPPKELVKSLASATPPEPEENSERVP
jgi:hypothetical protein